MTKVYDEHEHMTPEQRRALAMTASGPHGGEDDRQFRDAMAMHLADERRVRRQEVLQEALAIASTADAPPTHFATGRALDRMTGTKVRRATDPPDPEHTEELATPYIDRYREVYGLDEHGQPLADSALTEDQRAARAARYDGRS
jgi:hypothetical protein